MRKFAAAGALMLCLATTRCGEDADTGKTPSADPAASRAAEGETDHEPDEGAEGGATLFGADAAHEGGAEGPQQLAAAAEIQLDKDGKPTNNVLCRQNLAKSRYVGCTSKGRLGYAADKDSKAVLLDYSRVGYHGGDRPLPSVPLRQTLAPSGKDDTTALQNAINAVGARKPDANGFRGRIKLGPGVFKVNRTLLVVQSGIVIEGNGASGPRTTTVQLTGSATELFHVRGSGNAKVDATKYAIVKTGLPCGSNQLTLETTDGLKVGDLIRITSTRNSAWIKQIWGGTYPPVRDGKKQTAWGSSMDVQMPRTITKISGQTIALDTALPDGLPADKLAEKDGAYVQKLATDAYVREFGFAHLKLVGRYVNAIVGSGKLLTAITLERAEDGFIDDIEATDFGDSTVDLGAWTRQITVQDVRTIRTAEQPGSAKPFDISLRGQLILIQGCASSGNKTFYVATQTSDSAGPNVVQNYRAQGAGTFEPHQRWSTGLLYDNVYAPDGGIAFIDRGSGGSGHGWSMGYGVAYNSLAGTTNASKKGMNSMPGHTINQPPTAANFGIGLVGPNRSADTKDEHYDSAGKPVGPPSLWAYQLWQRRGAAGMALVMGPWQLRDHASDQCLAVDQVKDNAYVVLRDCNSAGQRALWDVTTYGSIRLGGTKYCMDADSDRRNTPIKLVACAEDTEQRWGIGARTGAQTQVTLLDSKKDDAGASCLALDGKTATIAACGAATERWQMVLSHLAR